MKEWTFAQKALAALAALQLVWALAGFIAEPSFHIGAGAPTAQVLGVDFNGYHALSGLLLFLPALYFARRPDWALYYDAFVAVALFATGIWAFLDRQPAWVFTFPDNAADGVFHLATGALFAILAAVQLAENRRLDPASGRASASV